MSQDNKRNIWFYDHNKLIPWRVTDIDDKPIRLIVNGEDIDNVLKIRWNFVLNELQVDIASDSVIYTIGIYPAEDQKIEVYL